MKSTVIHFAVAAAVLLCMVFLLVSWLAGAGKRLERVLAEKGTAPQAAVATATDEGYCSGQLRPILRRVLTSCGLVKGNQTRGCQPVEAKNVAAMSGTDFNALFRPLSQRAGIVMFDLDKFELDEPALALLDKTFGEQKGASYFLVVSRASPDGSQTHNRELSEKRADAVLEHLRTKFQDPDLEQEVGLLWLGEEFAQLDKEYCTWNRSRAQADCTTADLNRSAFIAWIDCRL
jgi:outer membrane protein OmpA-like peptidoglycan-associated protein